MLMPASTYVCHCMGSRSFCVNEVSMRIEYVLIRKRGVEIIENAHGMLVSKRRSQHGPSLRTAEQGKWKHLRSWLAADELIGAVGARTCVGGREDWGWGMSIFDGG